ncbi:MAG: septum formation initiator family protein [Parcubacteria group bacterium Licking1014_1]|nr:MAG: septum formation initiator family protein [Parcubacteria group bacterium Licking1014_1]
MLTHFKKKRKRVFFKNSFFIKIAGVLLLVISLLLIYADIKIYKNKQKLDSQLNNYKEQIKEIEKRNEDLEEGITKADDKDYIEKIAREEFGMQQPGEKVVTFVMPEQKKDEGGSKLKKNIFNISAWLEWLSNFWQSIKNIF